MRTVTALSAIVLLLVACAGPAAVPTPADEATPPPAAQTPTATPIAAATPTDPPTPPPTPEVPLTPAPTPEPTPEPVALCDLLPTEADLGDGWERQVPEQSGEDGTIVDRCQVRFFVSDEVNPAGLRITLTRHDSDQAATDHFVAERELLIAAGCDEIPMLDRDHDALFGAFCAQEPFLLFLSAAQRELSVDMRFSAGQAEVGWAADAGDERQRCF